MSVVTPKKDSSLRLHPDLRDMFKQAESRHLTEQELQQYLTAVPHCENRVKAAREVAKVESDIINMTIQDILAMYPFEKYHPGAEQKCFRDEVYVSVYATHAMLMNDTDWLRDKFLFWMGTIVKSFSFPVREEALNPSKSHIKAFNRYPDITRHADTLSENKRALYDTYARLMHRYAEALSPEAFTLMEAPLQLCLDILSSE